MSRELHQAHLVRDGCAGFVCFEEGQKAPLLNRLPQALQSYGQGLLPYFLD